MFHDRNIHPDAPWRALLLNAASLIEVHGHCKLGLMDEHGRLCFVGALAKAETGDANDAVCYGAAATDAYYNFRDFLGQDPVDYNNLPTTKARDLISKMRLCAYESTPAPAPESMGPKRFA